MSFVDGLQGWGWWCCERAETDVNLACPFVFNWIKGVEVYLGWVCRFLFLHFEEATQGLWMSRQGWLSLRWDVSLSENPGWEGSQCHCKGIENTCVDWVNGIFHAREPWHSEYMWIAITKKKYLFENIPKWIQVICVRGLQQVLENWIKKISLFLCKNFWNPFV